jgi:hypothetical protein
VLESDEETPSSGQSPKYQESNLNSSTTDTDNGGMEVANTLLNHLVVVHSSQVRSTNYVTYVHLIFSYMTNSAPFLSGQAEFIDVTQDTDQGAPTSQRVTIIESDRGRGMGGGRQHHLSLR